MAKRRTSNIFKFLEDEGFILDEIKQKEWVANNEDGNMIITIKEI